MNITEEIENVYKQYPELLVPCWVNVKCHWKEHTRLMHKAIMVVLDLPMTDTFEVLLSNISNKDLFVYYPDTCPAELKSANYFQLLTEYSVSDNLDTVLSRLVDIDKKTRASTTYYTHLKTKYTDPKDFGKRVSRLLNGDTTEAEYYSNEVKCIFESQ